MKKYKNLIFVTLVGLFLFSCTSVKDGLTLKKKENTEDSPSKRVNKVVEEAANQMVEKNKLYDVLELQTNGYFPPDTSYTSLTREAASSKYEELIQEGVSPDYIKVVTSRQGKYV